MTGRKKILIIMATAVIVVGLLIGAGYLLLPRFLGADEEVVAKRMPDDTAVFLELNLFNLQDASSRQLTTAWENSYEAADIPLNENDPSTLLNILDNPLNEIAGITVSKDVRPWVGLNIGLGIFATDNETEAPDWLIVTTVRDNAGADAFVEKLSANIAQQNGVHIGTESYSPIAQRDGNILLIASDETVLSKSLATKDGLSLADSKQYQQILAELPEDRGVTLFSEADSLLEWATTAVPPESAGVMEAALGILPEYTAVGLAGEAVAEGIQIQMVGFHNELNASQQEWLAAQTTLPELDMSLPTDTAVFLTGQRLDLIWQQLKGSLAGLGYSEGDIDESMEIFTNLFGFNPDADLLSSLNGEYAIAVLPTADATILSPIVLVEHDNPAALSTQTDQIGAGLNLLGFATEQENEIYNLSDQNGEHLLSFAQFDAGLMLGLDGEGFTAVGTQSPSLTDVPLYAESWSAFPDGSIPLLFLNLKELDTAVNWQTAVDIQPITHAALTTQSDESISRATIIFFIPTDLQ